MLAWIVSLGSWNWFILAALLLLVEVLAPGMFMLWLGLSAILVGIISSAVVWSWQAQLIAFAVFENADGSLRPGTVARAKIYTRRSSYGARAWRVLSRWLQTVVW